MKMNTEEMEKIDLKKNLCKREGESERQLCMEYMEYNKNQRLKFIFFHSDIRCMKSKILNKNCLRRFLS